MQSENRIHEKIAIGPDDRAARWNYAIAAMGRPRLQGRSGPGRLYLASPLTVAASAFEGRITPYHPGMFGAASRAIRA